MEETKHSEERQTKKSKRGYDWKIIISTPQTFKNLLTVMSKVLVQCPFQVLKGEKFCGIRVDSMDSSMVCMIKTSYQCNVEANIDLADESFCVMTEMFNTLLRECQPEYILELTRFSDSADVLSITYYDQKDDSNRSTFTLNILEYENRADQLRLDDITYKYMVEIDLVRLKGLCKIASEIHATYMEFKIDEPIDAAVGGICHLFFTIGAVGEIASMQKIHHSVTSSETTSSDKQIELTIRAVQVEESNVDFAALEASLNTCYNEVFSTTYLNLVLKSMERSSVNLYMSPGLPLVIRYALGNDLSNIQIVLAARVRETD